MNASLLTALGPPVTFDPFIFEEGPGRTLNRLAPELRLELLLAFLQRGGGKTWTPAAYPSHSRTLPRLASIGSEFTTRRQTV
jgi:hypothetical protein